MTDDEISEFAEALEWACQTSEVPVGDDGGRLYTDECNCPIGALVPCAPPWPTPGLAAAKLGLDENSVGSFIAGYDEMARQGDDPRLYDLGLQFRERYP